MAIFTQGLSFGVVGHECGDAVGIGFQTLTRRFRILHRWPFAPLPLPLIARAPFFRFGPNRSRAFANASFTNSLLPITAPSVKYRTRHRSIFAIPLLSTAHRFAITAPAIIHRIVHHSRSNRIQIDIRRHCALLTNPPYRQSFSPAKRFSDFLSITS